MKINTLKIGFCVLSMSFMAVSCNSKDSTADNVAAAVQQASVPVSELKIATVNMDSINMGYKMVADIQKELSDTEARLTKDVENQAASLQREYENYLKIGATLTLSEQKKREEALSQKQQSVAGLQQKYANQLVALQAQRTQEITSAVLEFVERFNAENGQYTMVITTGSASPILYSAPSMDITSAVLEGLNKEYADKQKSEK